jgi:hypothetical protein
MKKKFVKINFPPKNFKFKKKKKKKKKKELYSTKICCKSTHFESKVDVHHMH